MAVGGLERDEAVPDTVRFEAGDKAAVALAGGDGEQPVLGIELLDQRADAFEQWFAQRTGKAQVAKADLVGLDHRMALVVAGVRSKFAQGVG